MTLSVRTLTSAEHLAFVRTRDAVSFLQTPAWGEVKREWRAESVGWVDDTDAGTLLGAGLVLYRRMPRMRRSLAYLPEGPAINWSHPDLASWLAPLTEHVTSQGAFGIRMGPPVVSRRWAAGTVKAALAGDQWSRLADVPADTTDKTGVEVAEQLLALGWRPPADIPGGFAAGQPRYVFQIPLEGRDRESVLAGMNQLWRRNVKKAAKAGVEVMHAGPGELPEFHSLYVETARRDHFTPRPLAYFQTMFRALGAEDSGRVRLYLARHDGELAAASIGVQVGGHAWYSYGASATHKREVRPSNAIQWRMITDALDSGAKVYDLRGITDTLDESDPHVGLLQFKVGTGGEAVEYLGEWDLAISRILYTAFDFYMRRRGG